MKQPYAIIPLSILAEDLTGAELRCLSVLYSFADIKNNNFDVFPSLESIAERMGYKDSTSVSKLISRLAKKELLTKKKRGFSGGNIYSLKPTEKQANLAEVTNLENTTKNDLSETANLAELTKMVEPAMTNLAELTKSNLAEPAKCKEQTIEHTNEQTNKNILCDREQNLTGRDLVQNLSGKTPTEKPSGKKSPYPKKSQVDFKTWPTEPSDETWQGLLEHRKAKKSPVTQLVVNQIGKEITKLISNGWTTDAVIEEWVSAGWVGLKADWIQNRNFQQAANSDALPQRRNAVELVRNQVTYGPEAE